MPIEPLETENRIQASRDAAESKHVNADPLPTANEIAAKTQENLNDTHKTMVQSGASSKGSIINDLA
ncbi:MAG: hypothetical protein KKB70_11790 [Proteobacteria bacterium]|nr:hypothetical protein [Pseudomonadota bacterium]MBU1612494.1 hypothetical protein [Pseudomonadota bacterium]